MLQSCIIAFALLLPASLRAQEWEPVGNESFSAITGAEDGSLILLRYPGDILRSTDTGGTWEVVYRGSAPLTGFRVKGKGQRVEEGELIAYGDSDYALRSDDSGRTWQVPSTEYRVPSEDADSTLSPLPPTLYPFPAGTHSVSFADSAWWAVGEPGLICRWEGNRWREVHRAPFLDNPQPPPGPLLEKEGESSYIAFSSAAHGAIAVGNRIYFTNDSATTWSESTLPDTTSISSLFLLSDTSAMIGMRDGRLYYGSAGSFERYDSILGIGEGAGTAPLQNRGILRIGWKDKLDGELFVLTDSLLYSVRSDLSSATPNALPLDANERAVAARFPDAYTGFLLTDSLRRFDTLTSEGHDTSLLFDTCKIYRSLDGGATWNVVLKNIPSLINLYLENTKSGFVCSANGLIMHTEDTGSHWARAWTNTRQNLHDIDFVNETTGYAVGDSGVVLLTQTSGRFWRPLPPVPLFTHPGTAYTGAAFSGEHTVYVVANDRCYKAAIPQPINIHPHWHWPERHTLSISERPNPSSGRVEFDIRSTSKDDAQPDLKICNVSGTTLSEVSGLVSVTLGEWSATADLSSLPAGVYTAIVTDGSQQAMCKFLIER